MSSKNKNLDTFASETPSGKEYSVALIVAEWNHQVTFALRDGAIQTLKKAGVKKDHIHVHYVPGSYELPYGALTVLQNYTVDAAICLGCVIQGETPHFDYICQAVAKGCMDVQLEQKRPVIFGVLTTLDQQQALDRAGGKHGNKGSEAAHTALKMIQLTHSCAQNGDRDPMLDTMNGPLGSLLLQSALLNNEEDDFEFDFEEEEEEDKSYFGKGKKVELKPNKKKK
jgi:6,7-dimethyl-8-ribityllumazine synthase